MFGEYGLYLRGKFIGVICDNTLFIKVTGAGAEFAGRVARASPYPGAKDHLRISTAKLNDRDWLVALMEATWSALPDAKKSPRH
jgi:TfoX/Sxy family transcriptional regulator of competence genes